MARLAVISRLTTSKYEILDAWLLSVGLGGPEVVSKECPDLRRTCTEMVRHERTWLGFFEGTVEILAKHVCKRGAQVFGGFLPFSCHSRERVLRRVHYGPASVPHVRRWFAKVSGQLCVELQSTLYVHHEALDDKGLAVLKELTARRMQAPHEQSEIAGTVSHKKGATSQEHN
jgi:hypothetical protein